jgi:uncharacterized Zn-finger protein
MAQAELLKFSNDEGLAEIFVAVREFECTGASAPFDHPHVFLDMGSETEIVCPYCSTRYRFRAPD